MPFLNKDTDKYLGKDNILEDAVQDMHWSYPWVTVLSITSFATIFGLEMTN